MKTRNQETISLLNRFKSKGLTAKELDARASWGPNHGATSAVLSRLHKDGLIVRLTERREKYKVYVLPEWVKGRETTPQGRGKSGECTRPECMAMEAMYDDLAQAYAEVTMGK